ncbi:MAG: ribosomal-processing cysteine protease Prp [Bacilli bacterium]|nr:ribosomal-processing cysteine protease Prp [Bacilli bacterium]
MIKVKVKKNHIEILGHAMFDEYGKDIVCASASSIVITTVNAILKLDDKALIYNLSNDKLVIDVLSEAADVKILILNMIDLLKDLEKQYKENIQVTEEV